MIFLIFLSVQLRIRDPPYRTSYRQPAANQSSLLPKCPLIAQFNQRNVNACFAQASRDWPLCIVQSPANRVPAVLIDGCDNVDTRDVHSHLRRLGEQIPGRAPNDVSRWVDSYRDDYILRYRVARIDASSCTCKLIVAKSRTLE